MISAIYIDHEKNQKMLDIGLYIDPGQSSVDIVGFSDMLCNKVKTKTLGSLHQIQWSLKEKV